MLPLHALGFLWATGLKHEEKTSRSDCAARLMSNAHAHVFKVCDVRAIMSLQDVRTSNIFNAYKTCGQTATMLLQYYVGPVDHSRGTATSPDNSTGQCHIVDCAQRGR
jgi:hypothetical protein